MIVPQDRPLVGLQFRGYHHGRPILKAASRVMATEAIDAARGSAPASFALGVGLTNECNLACDFCYRDPTRVDRLSHEQVSAVMARLPTSATSPAISAIATRP